jgi:hypothetical protein
MLTVAFAGGARPGNALCRLCVQEGKTAEVHILVMESS